MPKDGKHTHTEKWHRCWEKVQAQGHDENTAAAICTASLGDASFNAAMAAEEEDVVPEMREVHLRFHASSLIRRETLDGKEYAVVPVTALVEGVVRAVNAPHPEFVASEKFSVAPAGWNGRPVFLNHPMKGGKPVSGNSPEVLKTAIGKIFNTKVDGKRLLMEAWLDPKLEVVQKILQRAEKEMVEISTGAFVVLKGDKGQHNGKDYLGVWDNIVPDHLAILDRGLTGACSCNMGCGIRAAMYDIKGEELEEVEQIRMMGGKGSGWFASEGHTKGSQGSHSDAAAAHKEAAGAHEAAAARAEQASKSNDSYLHSSAPAFSSDAKGLTSKATEATKATGAKPYSAQAANAYAKMAKSAPSLTDRAKYHKMAAQAHRGAAKDHQVAAKWTKRNSQEGDVSGIAGKVLNALKRALASSDDPTAQSLAEGIQVEDPFENPSEEKAELIQYQTMMTLLEQCGTAYDEVEGLIQDLVDAETGEAPSGDELAEEEIETAQLDAIKALVMSMTNSLYGIADLCRRLDSMGLNGMSPVAYMQSLRAAVGKRHSKSDAEMLQGVHDYSVKLGADCGAMRDSQTEEELRAACGCQGGEMDRKAKIAALVANEHNPVKSQKALEALTDAELTTLEADAEKAKKTSADLKAAQDKLAEPPKAKTEDEYLKEAPESIRTMVAEKKAADAAEHTQLVSSLKTAQKAYSEEELKTLPLAQLRKLAEVAEVERPVVDFSARAPRMTAASQQEGSYITQPPPDGYRIAMQKKHGEKEAVN